MTFAGIYIHFPFCNTKCMYCDFYSVADREDEISRFTSALIKEIEISYIDVAPCTIDSVFIGGGTPSLIRENQIELILNSLHKKFDLSQVKEWTMEANPGEAPYQKLQAFIAMGINRLSMGVQSLDPDLLKYLSRIHIVKDVFNTFENARKAGFDNINCDLIFNIPGQTLDIWQRDLSQITSLKPEHISAYSLTVEPGTLLHKLVKEKQIFIPGDDTAADYYIWTQEYLLSKDYEQYEISNWAKPGYECRHNLHYWEIKPYLAFGPSAHGFNGVKRYNNFRSLDKYFKCLDSSKLPIENNYTVSKQEMVNDIIGFGLRTNRGFQLSRIPKEFDIIIPNKWSQFIIKKNGRLKLTDEGYIFADAIAADLMV